MVNGRPGLTVPVGPVATPSGWPSTNSRSAVPCRWNATWCHAPSLYALLDITDAPLSPDWIRPWMRLLPGSARSQVWEYWSPTLYAQKIGWLPLVALYLI